MMDPDHTALCQALISDAEFAALFAPPRLRALLPPVGAAGVDPTLWLATLPPVRASSRVNAGACPARASGTWTNARACSRSWAPRRRTGGSRSPRPWC
jgi:hypothetical protein